MKLYHGNNQEVKIPVHNYSTRFRMDFGRGFYTTTSEEQAQRFTDTVMIRNENKGNKIVTTYSFNINAFKKLKIKDFDGAAKEWFEYVEANRRTDKGHNYRPSSR